mmetsp:Transcript_20919/g.62416  ORF Transcript_20919/g.62416 Transcript_20919/m.62416 type:complete len:206 (-) Transcript_20919:22-639(-)
MSGVVSGSSHLIIPKRIMAVASVAIVGGLSGILLSNHMYSRSVETFLKEKTQMVAKSNRQLESEQEDYRALFNKLTWQLDQDEAKGEGREYTKEEAGSFHQLAARLLEGLQSMQDLLEEKEFQLWEKEGLLEYQEERLVNTEDLETEMAGFINAMAATLLANNATLPEGLVDQPYYGASGRSDDGPGDAGIAGALARPGRAVVRP